MDIAYTTSGTCAYRIDVKVEDGILADVRFYGGCNGNLKGITELVKGMRADEAAERLRGIRCGGRPTSCPDQLARAIDRLSERQRGHDG
ncbi:MAG: TIGR03905 family TSCPD domain-containing protein [Oscillospiraceae bacterium]|nr:TIGR03905 family TSCPD domain-containing protein [Oscillospiraceae bacterium]